MTRARDFVVGAGSTGTGLPSSSALACTADTSCSFGDCFGAVATRVEPRDLRTAPREAGSSFCAVRRTRRGRLVDGADAKADSEHGAGVSRSACGTGSCAVFGDGGGERDSFDLLLTFTPIARPDRVFRTGGGAGASGVSWATAVALSLVFALFCSATDARVPRRGRCKTAFGGCLRLPRPRERLVPGITTSADKVPPKQITCCAPRLPCLRPSSIITNFWHGVSARPKSYRHRCAAPLELNPTWGDGSCHVTPVLLPRTLCGHCEAPCQLATGPHSQLNRRYRARC